MRTRYRELDNSLRAYFTGDLDVATEATDLTDEMTPEQVEAFLEQARAAATDPATDEEVDRFVDDAVAWDLGTGRETLLELVRHVEAARDAASSSADDVAPSSSSVRAPGDWITRDNVLDRLVAHVPEFRSEVEEHLGYHDELLVHLLFADLTRGVLRAREEGRDDIVRRALGFMDAAFRWGDADVVNAVQVSFVEHVEPWDPETHAFIEQWPRALRDEARRQGG